MKVEELRIGNLVISRNNGVSKVVQIGNSINPNYVGGLSLNGDYWENEYFEIEITEEWLFKLGFEMDNGFSTYIIKLFKGFLIIALDGSWGVYKDEYSNRTGSSYNNKLEIKYVHQLQNLYYALTGEELTINEI